jgi:retron-type reverse transcriptase
MGRLFNRITRLDNLAQAWQEVVDGKSGPGIDGVTIEEFARNWEANLVDLRAAVRGNCYRPDRLQRFTIPKRDGSPVSQNNTG